MKNRANTVANHDIKHKRVRLVSDDDSQVVDTKTALEQAREQDLDLVLINDQANPPVCKILDLNKHLYQQKQKEKDAAKSRRENRVVIKEVQFKPNIDDHDFETKCRRIEKFIKKGNRVKIMVQFKGRERQHSDIGYDLIDRIVETVEIAEFDGKPQYSGNRITALLKGSNSNGT